LGAGVAHFKAGQSAYNRERRHGHYHRVAEPFKGKGHGYSLRCDPLADALNYGPGTWGYKKMIADTRLDIV
jgi:hypothetical protein